MVLPRKDREVYRPADVGQPAPSGSSGRFRRVTLIASAPPDAFGPSRAVHRSAPSATACSRPPAAGPSPGCRPPSCEPRWTAGSVGPRSRSTSARWRRVPGRGRGWSPPRGSSSSIAASAVPSSWPRQRRKHAARPAAGGPTAPSVKPPSEPPVARSTIAPAARDAATAAHSPAVFEARRAAKSTPPSDSAISRVAAVASSPSTKHAAMAECPASRRRRFSSFFEGTSKVHGPPSSSALVITVAANAPSRSAATSIRLSRRSPGPAGRASDRSRPHGRGGRRAVVFAGVAVDHGVERPSRGGPAAHSCPSVGPGLRGP